MQWVKLYGELSPSSDVIYIGVVYIPPDKSKYYDEMQMRMLEEEIARFCSENERVILAGDYNARTSMMRDYICPDKLTFPDVDIFDFESDTDESLKMLESLNIQLHRESKNPKSNTLGISLLDICRHNNLFMLNGRYGNDKNVSQLTFRDKSVIDYVLSTAYCFNFIEDFSNNPRPRLPEVRPPFLQRHRAARRDCCTRHVIWQRAQWSSFSSLMSLGSPYNLVTAGNGSTGVLESDLLALTSISVCRLVLAVSWFGVPFRAMIGLLFMSLMVT